MALWFHGIQLNDDDCADAITDLSSSQGPGVNVHKVYGSATRDIEITGMDDDRFEIDIQLGERWSTTHESTQHLIALMRGIVSRLHPIHLYSDTVQLFEGSPEVFVAVETISYDYEKGINDDKAIAMVSLRGQLIGTPATMRAKFAPTTTQRKSDFEGVIASRSVMGLPKGSLNYSITLLEERNGTTVVDLGNNSTGFADDSLAAMEGEADSGTLTYELDTDGLEFLSNACVIYDEGYSPRRRVISRHHKFTGSAVIETELYRIVVNRGTGKFEFYAADGLGGYEGAAFEIFTMKTFSKVFVVAAQDEFCRLRTNAGDFVEVERGKDPLLIPASSVDLITYEVNGIVGSDATTTGAQYDFATYDNGVYNELRTQSFRNFVELEDSSGVWVASNFHFTIVETTKTFYGTTSPTPVGGVYQISKSDIPANGRNRELLKQIS